MRRTKAETWKLLVSAADSGLSSMNTRTHAHTHRHVGRSTELYPFLSSFLSQWFHLLFPVLLTQSGIMTLKGSSSAVGPLKRAWWGGGKVTLHQGTTLTTCPFNRQPIYSSRIFSQFLLHTAVPSQTPASDGTSGFTPRCAALPKGTRLILQHVPAHTPLSPAAPHFSHSAAQDVSFKHLVVSVYLTHTCTHEPCVRTFSMKKWVLMFLELWKET